MDISLLQLLPAGHDDRRKRILLENCLSVYGGHYWFARLEGDGIEDPRGEGRTPRDAILDLLEGLL